MPPWLDTFPSSWVLDSVICSFITPSGTWMSKSLRTPCFGFITVQPASAFPHLRLCFLTPQSSVSVLPYSLAPTMLAVCSQIPCIPPPQVTVLNGRADWGPQPYSLGAWTIVSGAPEVYFFRHKILSTGPEIQLNSRMLAQHV